MPDATPTAADFAALLEAWSERLPQSADAQPPRRPALVPHLAAAADRLLDDAWISLDLSGIDAGRDLVRARAETVFPPDPADRWPAPDPAARIKAPAPREFIPGEIDPMTLAAVDGYLAAQRIFKDTVLRLLQGDEPGPVMADETPRWAAALLEPWSRAGFLPPRPGAGFRTRQVPGCPSGHTACAPEEVSACLDLLWRRDDLAPKPLLAHMGLLWIRPWPVGNGRLARLAHAALALGAGHPWPLPRTNRAAAYAPAVVRAFAGDPLPLAAIYTR